uniref:Trehalase n=1 Tax=Parascaris univalens TaxID=6257 RepID=A0A915C2N6_PARUN
MLPICERLVEVGQLGGARSASRWLYSQPRVVKKLQSYPCVCYEAVVSRSLSPPHSGVQSSSSPLLLDRLGVARLGQPPTFSGQSVDEGFQQVDITIQLFDLTQPSTASASENIVDTRRVIAQNSNMVIKGQPLNMKQQIYCGGSLLDAVQKARIFQDCKHFVDMPLKADAESTLSAWQALVSRGHLDEASLRQFVTNYFDEPGGELDDFRPMDFDPEYKKFDAISCPSYRQWAKELHRKWPTLCRKVSDRVLADPNRYSLIALPKPFVIPGGRFREMYYWDSFFTIKGLLASGMHETVRGMIENMGHLIDEFGYVPNGNRVYYLNRSQPPLLTWCLAAYYEATGDKEFLLTGARWFERELEFFQNRRSIQLEGVASPLYRYCVVVDGPRPESYREDMESAEHIQDPFEKQRLWGDIAAAAESGRDFSSRWFSRDGPAAGKMGSTRTSSILPVDLNAIICGNWRLMADMYDAMDDHSSAENCRRNFDAMRHAIHQVFWNEECGCWFDFDIVSGRHVADYMDTNFFPLFTGCTHDGFDPTKVVSYLCNTGVLSYPGGLPSSLTASGQQWDFPNAWAPTTWVIIQGLRASGQQALARQIAQKWIRKNYNTWISSGGRMFEKYNVASTCVNAAGGGGEYEVQEGFGWTNGVILDLLLTYGPDLSFSVEDSTDPEYESETESESERSSTPTPEAEACRM